jgi:hypothetical protein
MDYGSGWMKFVTRRKSREINHGFIYFVIRGRFILATTKRRHFKNNFSFIAEI